MARGYYAGVGERLVVEEAVHQAERREGFIQLLAWPGHRVVTVVEVLSPSSKRPGEGRARYLEKQREVLASPDVSLVEVDLLRGGEPTVSLAPRLLPASLYRMVTARAGARDKREVYAFGLRERLPLVAIPVTPEHGDVVLDLPAILADVYERAAYGERVDHAAEPTPPLPPEDAAWARERTAAARPRA